MRRVKRNRKSKNVVVAVAVSVAALSWVWPGWAGQDESDGIRCETRLQPRAISWRNYVLDHVTRCVPTGDATRAAVEPETAIERSLEPAERDRSLAAPPVRLPRWSPDRTRLANEQFERTLRAIGETSAR